MCQELESKYLLAYCIRTMQRELPTCKQGSLNMVAYTAKFHKLSICAKVNENDLMLVYHYRQGLHQHEMVLFGLTFFNKIYQKPCKIEQQL